MKRFFLSTLLVGGLLFTATAQDFHMPKASPTTTVKQGFSTSYISLNYSRPGVKGRAVFGAMIPYGKIWRTGANSATKISFGEDVMLSGNKVEKGTYELYTIPGEEEWEIILNSDLGNWGAAGYDKNKNVLSFKVPVTPLKEIQESFRISIENLRRTSCTIDLAWGKVKVAIPVKADNNEEILAYLEDKLKGEKPPYSTAAGYYMRTNQKLDDALKYYDLAIKSNPKAYYLFWHKAEVLEKLGRHEEAVKAAKKAATLAKSSPAFAYEYQHKYETLKNKK